MVKGAQVRVGCLEGLWTHTECADLKCEASFSIYHSVTSLVFNVWPFTILKISPMVFKKCVDKIWPNTNQHQRLYQKLKRPNFAKCSHTGNQCGQIGRFFKVLGDIISFKSTPNVWRLLGYFENITFKKN